MHELAHTRLPLGRAMTADDGVWLLDNRPGSGVAAVQMRDLLRDATQSDWYLEHTGGGCTCLTLQGEGGMWAIFEDFNAPMTLDDPMILTWNEGQVRYAEFDYAPHQLHTLAEMVPFRDIITLCERMARGDLAPHALPQGTF